MSAFTDLSSWYEPLSKISTGWRAIFERQRYITTKPISWENGSKGSGHWVHVPAGYVFDVSIPLPLWPILSPTDPRFHKAACLHDRCLEVLGWGRVSSAASFSDALKATGVGKWTRLSMVLGVIVWHWK